MKKRCLLQGEAWSTLRACMHDEDEGGGGKPGTQYDKIRYRRVQYKVV